MAEEVLAEDKIVEFYVESKEVVPYKKHKGDAGWDLRSKDHYTILPDETMKIPTGVRAVIPEGYVGIVKPRSSWGIEGFDVTAGVIDSTYRGEIHVVLQNHSNRAKYIGKGERIAQLIVVPILMKAKAKLGKPPIDTDRGEKGFGSTGKE